VVNSWIKQKKESGVIIMNMLIWFIKAVSVSAVILISVVAIDLTIGTSMAQSMADYLATGGYTVSVVSPIGAPKIFQAPEIDAASGTSAIALLTGIILLMQERRRSKRSSKSDE
jgi:hypothetical protein